MTKFYPQVSTELGVHTTFWFFGACCVLGALHVVLFVPETKGRSTQQILDTLAK